MPSAPITLDSPLTLRNAWRFPIQHARARRDLAWGAVLFLLLPGIGWMLNMGFRLRLIHRMQRRQDPWPAWGNYGTLLRHGFVTTALILLFHLPAGACALAAWFAESRPLAAALWVLAAAVLIPALYILPGFMTFYARDYDLGELLDFRRALRRVRAGGAAYRKAWLIVLPATGVSMLGVAALGVGFAFTSVWLWQVAAFCFARVFSERFDLILPDSQRQPPSNVSTAEVCP